LDRLHNRVSPATSVDSHQPYEQNDYSSKTSDEEDKENTHYRQKGTYNLKLVQC